MIYGCVTLDLFLSNVIEEILQGSTLISMAGEQLSGIRVSDDSLWQWIQRCGYKAMGRWNCDVERWQHGHAPPLEALSDEMAAMPLIFRTVGNAR